MMRGGGLMYWTRTIFPISALILKRRRRMRRRKTIL
jgi:hypothetical protein